jgi:hypothetical protein
MHRLKFVFILAVGCFLLNNLSRAQDTNVYPLAPATKLEALEMSIGTIIFKASTEMGVVSVNTGIVSVKAKESTDMSSGLKELGVAIDIRREGGFRELMLIDYDELGPLLSNIDYLSKLDFSVTALNAFDAAHTTKGGFRIAALGTRSTGLIQFGVRNARTSAIPVLFSRQNMTQFWTLIDQAKKQLDALRG